MLHVGNASPHHNFTYRLALQIPLHIICCVFSTQICRYIMILHRLLPVCIVGDPNCWMANISCCTPAASGVVTVEEAGELLEAHVLTSLSPHTKHLVMIGDQCQLRPKVSICQSLC